MDVPATLDLLDYRRRVADLYHDVRAEPDPARAWRRWRDGRDELMRSHPSSPYPPDRRPAGLAYFDHDPALRTTGTVEPVDDAHVLAIAHSSDGTTDARRFARVRFRLAGREHRLSLFWLDQYGGGLFLPFRDATSGDTTYGGGRYLLDTAKGADLGSGGATLVLDFNLAYHPSCVHDPRWSCPLAPPENRLEVPVRGGERLPPA